jgi:hypothetical protein
MIVREPFEIAYQADQAHRARTEDQQAEAWGLDSVALEELIRRWGTKAVLTELAAIHERVTPDGSKVLWSLPSSAYLLGNYDSPDPCDFYEF